MCVCNRKIYLFTFSERNLQNSRRIPFPTRWTIITNRYYLKAIPIDVHFLTFLGRPRSAHIHVKRIRTGSSQAHVFRPLRFDALLQTDRSVKSTEWVLRLAFVVAECLRVVDDYLFFFIKCIHIQIHLYYI